MTSHRRRIAGGLSAGATVGTLLLGNARMVQIGNETNNAVAA